MTNSTKIQKLSSEQLKAELKRCAKMTKERMAPLLYFLRLKLKKQGSRRGEGFGAWVAAYLPITRRTADLWANEWAVANRLMKATSRNISKSCVPASRNEDDLYSIEFAFEPEERKEFHRATQILGPAATQRVIYEAVIEAAKAKPKARRAASGV
jgi:hypothetical protein